MKNSKKFLAKVSLIALALAACSPQSGGDTQTLEGEVLPFIKDDYAGALALAQEKDIPIFVDAWAPW